MPTAKPEEFRRRAVKLARSGEKPVRWWMAESEIEEGRAQGLDRDERAELARLRHEDRAQAMEIEILKCASAYFARNSIAEEYLQHARVLNGIAE